MKGLQYLNFPVSFLKTVDLTVVLEEALLFCSYETMKRVKSDRAHFYDLIEMHGLVETELKYDLYSKAKDLYDANVKSVRCGVNHIAFINYLNTSNDNLLNIEFRAYCATKAIIGKKVYMKTNFKEIFSLMFGYKNYCDLSEKTLLKISSFEKARAKRKILERLEVKWHLSIYSLHSRGMYISYKFSPVELIVEVKKSKMVSKIKQKINEKKADAILLKFMDEIDVSSG